MSFESALALTLQFEGGFVDDPRDPGGRTNKGITQRTYDDWQKKLGVPHADVKDIHDNEVAAIYKTGYWNKGRCDVLKEPLATIHFDTSVNLGVGRATGMMSLSAGNPTTYLDLREKYYRDLIVKRPTMAVFLKGWLRRVNKLRGLLIPF